MHSYDYHTSDSDGIVLIKNGTMKYFTNVQQVIYEMDATILFDFVDLIVNTFSLLSAANQMYSEKFRCERMWSNRDFDIMYDYKLDYIDTRRNHKHVKTDHYFKNTEKYLKFKVISQRFNVVNDDLMHDLYNIHKKLNNITYSLKSEYSLYGRKPSLTKFLQNAYDVSINALNKYSPVLMKLYRMNVTDLVEYDSQFVTLIYDMQRRLNNKFVYDPVKIFENFEVINDKTMIYVISNIYLTTRDTYMIYIVHSLMIRHPRSSLTTFLNIPGDILCDNLKYKGNYFYMSWEESNKCIEERGQKICPVNPVLKDSEKERDCIYSIHKKEFDIKKCSKDLMYSQYIQKTSFKRLDSNAWYYYIHSSGIFHMICGLENIQKVLIQTGLILLDDHCIAWFEERGQEDVKLKKDLSKETEFDYQLMSFSNSREYKDMLLKKNVFKRIDSKAY